MGKSSGPQDTSATGQVATMKRESMEKPELMLHKDNGVQIFTQINEYLSTLEYKSVPDYDFLSDRLTLLKTLLTQDSTCDKGVDRLEKCGDPSERMGHQIKKRKERVPSSADMLVSNGRHVEAEPSSDHQSYGSIIQYISMLKSVGDLFSTIFFFFSFKY